MTLALIAGAGALPAALAAALPHAPSLPRWRALPPKA